ncbi:MAG TPA: hypothetical protein P5534_02060 [Candidatus Paceibacterota bacterium]|nr:hypothetical protein [Candidatus Paceibacterota bacterium]
MKLKYADWIRQDTDEIVAVFGQAELVRRLDGKTELRGGTEQDRVAAKEWIALFWHETVLEQR